MFMLHHPLVPPSNWFVLDGPGTVQDFRFMFPYTWETYLVSLCNDYLRHPVEHFSL